MIKYFRLYVKMTWEEIHRKEMEDWQKILFKPPVIFLFHSFYAEDEGTGLASNLYIVSCGIL
jgi:hypothetical protein